ncbi:hypothetical protein [Persephonella sp.]
MMEKTPYDIEFLWNQLKRGWGEIRKKKYKELLSSYFEDDDIKRELSKKKDRKGRNYEGGALEKTASVISLALCIYDNYPESDIDLILTAILMNFFCMNYTKKECYKMLEDYPELIPFLFKKNRKKPTLELIIFENLYKFDDKIYKQLKRKRGEDGS